MLKSASHPIQLTNLDLGLKIRDDKEELPLRLQMQRQINFGQLPIAACASTKHLKKKSAILLRLSYDRNPTAKLEKLNVTMPSFNH